MASQREDERPQPRLYLVTPPLADSAGFPDALEAALGAADVAAVLVRIADDSESTQIKRVKAIATAIQNVEAALILDNRPDLVARARADGAHLRGIEAFEAAVGELKPNGIAGAGEMLTRHDAMLAAERGADYVMFGEPDSSGHRQPFDLILERIEWWQDVFQTPCVGFAASLDEVPLLARTGADFVALGDFVFDGKRTASDIVAEAAAALVIQPERTE